MRDRETALSTSVLVLGGGFAGLSAVRALSRAARGEMSVRLIDAREDSEFSPLYPDVISGTIQPASIRLPLGPFCGRYGAEFIHAAIRRIDGRRGLVETERGDYTGDFLICALGCRTNFHGNRAMEERALQLKSIDAALRIREAALGLLGTARALGRTPHLLVVGGGYTGFETASHLAVLLRRRAHVSPGELVRLMVLERDEQVLRLVDPRARDWAVRRVRNSGIEVHTRLTVEGYSDGDIVRLSDGREVGPALVIWAAGVMPVHPVEAMEAAKVQAGRLKMDQFLRVAGHERLFAAGDVAGFIPPGQSAPLRMSVQQSLSQGRMAAGNVLRAVRGRPPRAYRPFDPGYVVPLAQGIGAGEVLGRELHGRLPWCLHYLMSAYRSWGWANRMGVLRDVLTSGWR